MNDLKAMIRNKNYFLFSIINNSFDAIISSSNLIAQKANDNLLQVNYKNLISRADLDYTKPASEVKKVCRSGMELQDHLYGQNLSR